MNSPSLKSAAIRSGIWHRSSFPKEMPLREQALTVVKRHVSVSDSGIPPSKIADERAATERDLHNAIEVLRCQVQKDNEVLTALAHLAASSQFDSIRAFAREAIEQKF